MAYYGYAGLLSYNIFTYTNDGMSRQEQLFGLKKVIVCPNRDENDVICKKTGNNYSSPYLSEMPLVGNENRPKSVIWLACEKD